MPDTTPNLALPEIAAAQAQKHVTHNEALRALDALVHLAVLDRDLSAPPGTPAEGQRWLVAAGAGGEWIGKTDQIAAWQDGGWQFYAPSIGWLAYVIDEGALLAWSGAAWEPALDMVGGASELQNMARLGLGTTADATNPFSAKLNNALWVARTGAEGGDGDLRYKLSKESAAKTLSLLFQSNFSGRAEIGLTGDDDFHFKVSSDGATWREAIVIDNGTGQVSFPQGGNSADLEITLAELALQVADNANAALFLGASGNRFADSFDALGHVDTAGATNLDTGTAGLLKPSATSSGDAVPAMTSNTTPSGTAAATSSLAGFAPWNVFDNVVGGTAGWLSNGVPSGGSPQELSYDFGANTACSGYTLQASDGVSMANETARAPNAWTFEGWNGSAWTVLDTQSGVTWTSGQKKTYMLGAPATGYSKFRWKFTANNGGASGVGFNEAEILGVAATNNLTVASTALTASSAPSTVRLVARVKFVDAITLNTDLIFDVSRDGGTTWTAATMTDRFTSPSPAAGIHVLESNAVDVTGQPSGTNVKWRARTANGKHIELHGIYLSWS